MEIVGLMLVKEKSRRLPGKNTKDFKGLPMFIWNLRKCLRVFEHVYVSSDSYEILQLASKEGAIAIHRGEELCGDVPDIPVFAHALKHMDPKVDAIVAVHANNPTIDRNLIAIAKKCLEMGVPEAMSCHPMTKERKKNYKKQGNLVNGSIRGMTRERLENYPDPYHPNPEMLFVDYSLEIETPEDFNQLQND
jgi:CMP-N-acetylneuraminic acid synthetase